MMITRDELVAFHCEAYREWARKYGPPAGTYRQWWRIMPKKYRKALAYYAANLPHQWMPAEVLRHQAVFWVREQLAIRRSLPFRIWWRLARDPDPVVRGAVPGAWAAWGRTSPWKMTKALLSDPVAHVRYNTLLAQDILPGAWVDKLMRDPDPATRRYAARFTPTSERRKRI